MQIKPILITPITDEKSKARAARVRAVLSKVNDLRTEHTYTHNVELVAVAGRAEARLDALGLPEKARPGAVYTAVSGERVPRAYKYNRDATRVTLARRASGWWLTEVSAVAIHRDPPRPVLCLTAAQDAAAVAELRKGYEVFTDFANGDYGSYATK